VEVVVNHLEPYKIGEKSSFVLEEIFKIDTEKDEIANLGIIDIRGFEVNSEGEIFILRNIKGEGNFIFKFDRSGKFVKSFGLQGQGPREIQIPYHIALDCEDNILIADSGRRALVKYDPNGSFIDSYEMKRGKVVITSGPRTNLLALEHSIDSETGKQLFFLKLLNSDLEILKEIDKFSYFFEERPGKFRATEPLFCWSSSGDNIFVANEERGYDIWVYDFEGKLIRKINKEYRKIPVSEKYKEKILKAFPENARKMVYFPEFQPPFQSIAAGDDGRLLVLTFEEGEKPGEFMVDIFNKDGVFIGRKSLNIFVWEGHLWA